VLFFFSFPAEPFILYLQKCESRAKMMERVKTEEEQHASNRLNKNVKFPNDEL
jgi:hypothetical protein